MPNPLYTDTGLFVALFKGTKVYLFALSNRITSAAQ